MSCSCRTTPLKVFIQSLTDLRLSESAVAVQPRYTRAVGLRSQFIFTRPYTATAALGFPRQISSRKALRGLPLQSPITHRVPEVKEQEQTGNEAVAQPVVEALDANRHKYAAAKSKGAILELSPESIDSLLADMEQSREPSPPEQLPEHPLEPSPKPSPEPSPEPLLESLPESLPSNLRFEPESAIHDEKTKSDPKPTSKESARLKKLKVLKELKDKKHKETMKKPKKQRKEMWKIQKEALKEKFPEGWKPRKRLSPDALDGIRALNAQFPDHFTTEELAAKFEVSPEAIRRILRSNWTPSAEEEEDRLRRWFSRGKNIWTQMAAIGRKPPRRWRQEGIVRDPVWNIPKGPRTQPPKQRKPRRFDADEDAAAVADAVADAVAGQSLEGNPDGALTEKPNEAPIIDANAEFHRKMKMQSNRKSQKGHGNKFNKNKGYNKNFNKGSNRDSSKGPNQKPKRAPKEDNRDPFEKAFDARLDPNSTRGPAQKSQW
ncbi:hypothetical protein ABKA04_003014 [Annulohypoxylon sp. FPYF3050]